MAKETTIAFVYDTELLKKEEDDPNSAILYFYPTWASEQQKTALCGQLMGTITCLRGLFSLPKIVALQAGKFCFIQNQRYILAIGSDKNTLNWILEHKANIMYSLINFFHKDFVKLAALYQDEALHVKLYHMFDVYLKILLYGNNIFSQTFLFQAPKNCSVAVSEANNFLENCRELPNVLGGAILFHNKVVSTQLSVDTMKVLVLSDPYRIKSPAETFKMDFEVPEGIQLFQVYISNKEFCDLLEHSLQNHYIFQYFKNKNIKKPNLKNHETDSSLLFTAVPEEDVPADLEPSKPIQRKPRPKSLNLRSISVESSDAQYSYRATPITPFCGQNSMVDTPMTEFKTFVLEEPSSRKNDKVVKDVKDRTKETYMKQGSSLTDITEALNSISLKPTQYFNIKNKILLPPKKSIKLKRSKTVHDPYFPIFRKNGMAASNRSFPDTVRIEDPIQFTSKKHRKSLTLPLRAIEVQNNQRRYSTGVQLTPLMSKLTVLALEEQRQSTKFTVNLKKMRELKQEDRNILQNCVLLVLGTGDLVLTLLLKDDISKDKETILKLHGLCHERLPQLQKQLHLLVESQNKVSKSRPDTEPYSFICLDDKWDMVKRRGPWNLTDEGVVNTVHEDFRSDADINEVLIRKPESTIYAYHSSSSEVFYHEESSLAKGLLSPTDAMGSVQTRARQRLERDHSILY